MEPVLLSEFRPTEGVALTPDQLLQLRTLTKSITISPSINGPGLYDLTPGAHVGVIHLDGLDLVVRPKIEMDRLLFILSYALGNIQWQGPLGLAGSDLTEAVVHAFVAHMTQALRRGLPYSYRAVEETSLTVRGRLRVSDQVRRWYTIAPPVEITYDDFTVDNDVNRLLLAATERLLRSRLRSERSRTGLRGILARLEGVTLVAFDPRRVPAVSFNRLNARFRTAVELARFIIMSTSVELGIGHVPGTAFLVDMNKAFEDFLVVALREALGLSDRELVQGARGRAIYLDEERQVRLEPDISIWRDGYPVFIGDAKYKRTVLQDSPNADIYQTVAYAIATNLPGALLIYAAGEGEPGLHTIVDVGKRIEVVSLDLSGGPEAIRNEVARIADLVSARAHGSGIAA